jgi:uncharacterized membrane protein (Fun14 family)
MVLDHIALVVGLVPAVLDGLPIQDIGFEAGGGALIGGVIGFAAKKIAKLIAILIGLELALFKFLEARGVLQVNWSRITNASSNVSERAAEDGRNFLDSIVATLPVGAGFTGGFFVGFKKG